MRACVCVNIYPCPVDTVLISSWHIDLMYTVEFPKWCVFLIVAELVSEHAQKVAVLEQAMQQKLKEKQKVYEEAFKQDMQQYLSTGYLQPRGQ